MGASHGLIHNSYGINRDDRKVEYTGGEGGSDGIWDGMLHCLGHAVEFL